MSVVLTALAVTSDSRACWVRVVVAYIVVVSAVVVATTVVICCGVIVVPIASADAQELGYSEAELDEMEAAGVFGKSDTKEQG